MLRTTHHAALRHLAWIFTTANCPGSIAASGFSTCTSTRYTWASGTSRFGSSLGFTASGPPPRWVSWIGTVVAYKAVLLEGTEVAFIVISFGAKGVGAMSAAIWGAAAAGVIVTAVAAALRHPLTAVPENLLKFIVGAMLTTFGIFWFGEGVGAAWPGDAASIPVILGLVLVTSWVSVRMLGVVLPEGARVEARNV